MAERPHSLSPRGLAIAGWIAFVAAGFVFMSLAWNVSSHAPLVILDAHIAAWWHENRLPAVTTFLFGVTYAHSILAMTLWSAIFAAVLARLRERYWLLTLALAVGGGLALNSVLKLAYERARPHFDDPLLTLSTYSFPSGHTAAATVFYGTLAAFLVSRTAARSTRAAIVALAVLLVSLVAFSRVYLGAHYVSDVVAAIGSSTAWLVLCLSGVHGLVKARRMARA